VSSRPDKLKENMTEEAWAVYLERKRAYVRGLTVEEMREMLSGGCALCGTHEGLCIDHDHDSDKVRGVLCDTHNRALGMLGDTRESIERVLSYLS
jgi:hypothetical protein